MQSPGTTKKLWFRRKTYGWGWTPITWEGWVTLLAYILGLYVPFFSVDLSNVTLENIGTRFIVHFVVLTAVLIWICYMKGESPRWQWGKEK